MTFIALALLGFGFTDLVRWSPGKVGAWRAGVAAMAGAVVVAVVAALSGNDSGEVAIATFISLVLLSLWSFYDLIDSKRAKPEYPIALMIGTVLTLLALSGSADRIEGEIGAWYRNLDLGFTNRIPVDQFILGTGAAIFLLATGNRIVRFLLMATEVRLLKSEGAMRGGRVIGPMERLLVAAAIVSGGIAAAGFVIAAKGLLRFSEIRPPAHARVRRIRPSVDEITEYFLIGTFTSILVAGSIALLVLAAA